MKQALGIILFAGIFLLLANPFAAQESNESMVNETNETNGTVPSPEQEPEPVPEIREIALIDVFPKKFNLGDVQLNILVNNTGTVSLTDIGAIVAGDGIATYNAAPIDILRPGEKNYIILFINAKKAGNITLDLKILGKSYRTVLSVHNPNALPDMKQRQFEQELLLNRTAALGEQLSNLTREFDALEAEYYAKRAQDYSLAMDTGDAKTYLRNTQASYAKHDLDGTEANLVLLRSELESLKQNMAKAVKRKKPLNERMRENVPWITALLTGLIAIVTLTERFKKKKDELTERLRHVESELRKRERGKGRKQKRKMQRSP